MDELKAWPNTASDRVQLHVPKHMNGEIFIQVMGATGKLHTMPDTLPIHTGGSIFPLRV